jgi:protein-L-isoaspartate(D-aspartate) O-methyltransferase
VSERQPDEWVRLRARMVERQLRRRGIADVRVLAAMGRVPREAFLPPELVRFAYDDAALPIGEDQTMSQPFIVATMCELLALDGSERVLDIGTGSGYAAAVLDELAAAVVSIERIGALAGRARLALDRAGHRSVEVRVGDGRRGAPDRAPFDAVSIAAATDHVPPALFAQLGPGGRLVLPRGDRGGQRLVRIVKTSDGPVETASLACRFVPLVQDEDGPG